MGDGGGGDPRFSTYEPFARGGWPRVAAQREGMCNEGWCFSLRFFPSRRALLMYSLTNVSKLSFTVFYFAFWDNFSWVSFARGVNEAGKIRGGDGFFGGFLARSIRGGWWKTNTIGKCEKNRANLTLQMFG